MKHPDYLDTYDADDNKHDAYLLRCKRCGSDEVRWRQQGGKWVLFSLAPGVPHACDMSDDFDVLTAP